MLASTSSFLLPEYILQQVAESLQRALGGLAAEIPTGDSTAHPAPAIQMRVFLDDKASPVEPETLPLGRWGFFMVQKREQLSGATRLCLDLFFYRD